MTDVPGNGIGLCYLIAFGQTAQYMFWRLIYIVNEGGFARTARPLWLIFAGLGALIFALGFYSTSSRGLRSAARLAPLIAGQPAQL